MKPGKKIKNPILWVINGILLSALVLACATSTADFAGLGKAADKVPLTSRAISGTLPNGLKYFIMENSRPENRAHLALVVNAGSVLERDDERGLAHFVEHLAFNDTARFPKLELIEYLRSLGMRYGADANAYTYYDETVFYFDVPVENTDGVKQIPDRALAILDDWTYAVSFLPEDVKSESQVVLEEHRTGLGAINRVRKITLPILFAGSAYANRNPIGLPEIIGNASPQQVRDFYDRWYKSDNMALVFVGDFDGKALETELARHFNMPASPQPVNRPLYELPPPKKGNFQVEIITDPELTSADYLIYFKQKPGAQKGTLAYYRESLIDYLIDNMLTMRFEEITSKPQAAAIEHWGGVWDFSTNARFYSMGTQPKTGEAESALRELLLEKEAMRRYGFTESELERAKLKLISSMEELLSEKDKRDSRYYLEGFASHFIHGEVMADIEWEVDALYLLLPGIGLKETTAAAKKYFSYDDCVVFLMAPQAEAENLPSKERIKAIFRETARAKTARKKSQSFTSKLLDKQPLPGSITSETTDRETGALILNLSNGAKVILKQTKNKNNEVILYAIARGGTLNAPDDEAVSADLASEMVEVSGLGPYSRTELIKKLAGKQVSFSFLASGYYREFEGSSTTKDLKTLFEMLHLFFTKPGLDESAAAALIARYRTILAHQDEDPENVFWREVDKSIDSNHPRFKPLEESDMDKVSVEQAFNFISRCVNPSDYTFVFTGNFDVSDMRDLCAMFIASIPAAEQMNTWIDPKVALPGKIEKNIYMGKDDKCSVYLGWFAPGPDGFDEERIQRTAILSEYLDIILTDEIREKLGGVYSIFAGASVNVIPRGEYSLRVYFQCNPARAKELIAAVQELLTEVYTKPLKQDVFTKSVEALLKEHENSMQNNTHIAQSYANSSVLYNTPLSRLNLRPASIKAVSPESVRSLCREMLASGPVQVVLYPLGSE